MQRKVSPNKEGRGFQVDVSGSFNTSVPAVLRSNVKEWLHDPGQNKDFIIKKHQDVLLKRPGIHENYKKKSV